MRLLVVVALCATACFHHGAVVVKAWTMTPVNSVSRRDFVATAGVAAVMVAQPSLAVEETPRVTTRMGGLLEAFQDGPRSIRIMSPAGWNKFEGEPGAYDLKWQDLVDPAENIKISSTPVKSTTDSIAVLGPAAELGPVLAAKRNNAQLIAVAERTTDGILFYQFEFALPQEKTHQLLQLCVAKGKLWSIDASAKESRWSKRDELYHNVLNSFMPKLA
jgi:photosystem II oxygen-evolving enhancer protein 2